MRTFILCLVFLTIFSILDAVPTSWNNYIEETALDFHFKIRGDRPFSDKIAVIYIGDNDIKALGGWPISRDYYSYAIHILSESGARVIGLDLFFSKADPNFPEFDTILSEFLQSAGGTCIPMYFSNLKVNPANPSDMLIAENPNLPLELFIHAADGIGFSNLGKQTKIREIPLLVSSGDSVFASFGYELFRLYNGEDGPIKTSDMSLTLNNSSGTQSRYKLGKNYKLRLNHFGSIDKIKQFSLVSLITDYSRNPESFDFKDKIVVIMMAASGIAPMVQTPLSTLMPASFMHVTAAENLLENNYIRSLPFYFHWVLIAIMLSAALFCLRQHKIILFITLIVVCISLYIFFSIILFRQYNILTPVFYPLLAFGAMLIYGIVHRVKKSRIEENTMRMLLDEQLHVKEAELHQTKILLSQFQDEIRQKSVVTKQKDDLVREQKSEIIRLQNEINDLKTYMSTHRVKVSAAFEEIICAPDGKMNQILITLNKIGSDDIAVLITGETGTGKELIARAIHNMSKRKGKPFVAVNCGALSETLLESELFGHEKGSFTGALNRRIGRFEMAHGGTIFLDEISETSSAFQIKLLRVLQESSFERVGGQETIHLNIRIVAATNKNLQHALESNQFRQDLYYRLNGFPIHLPPLRERREDIPLLAEHFLQKFKSGTVAHFSENSITALQAYLWPGNVRELENVVHRAVILAQADGRQIIQKDDLDLLADEFSVADDLSSLHKPLEEQILESLRTLRFEHTSISKTAKALGNRDRGTITEYFRGICFREFVQSDYDKLKTIQNIANTTDKKVLDRVEAKFNEYLDNLSNVVTNESGPENMLQPYLGLPKKYHTYLDRLISYLKEK